MTYFFNSVSKYDFTAFSSEQLLSQGTLGSDVGCGDTFTMPAFADACFTVTDDDKYLSGDACWNERSDDHSYQTASIVKDGCEAGNGCKIYAESYFWVQDQNGCKYVMIEIEQEGGCGSYFTFYSAYGMPPAGAKLTIKSECGVQSNWVDYNCLGAGPKLEPGSVGGRLYLDADYDNTENNADTGTWENGVAGAKVELIDTSGKVVATTHTDSSGTYKFNCLTPGDYKVKFYNPDGTEFVQKDVGADGEDSDANADGVTDTFTIGSGQNLWNVDGGVMTPPPANGGSCQVFEAEDMSLYGYTVENRGDASDGAGIKLCSGTGYASTTFKGEAGKYDLTIWGMDESDGQGRIEVYVNGCWIKTICLNEDDNGDGTDGSSSWTPYELDDVALKNGDVITLKGVGQCSEYARIDKIEICQPACDPCVTIEAEDMCAYNYTTVCGQQASGNELVKLTTNYCGGVNDGWLKTTFKGCDGTYDLTIFAQDENDGQSAIKVYVKGAYVGTILLNGDTDGSGNDNGTFTAFTLEGVRVNYGDEIKLVADSDGGEFVRIDKIKLCTGQEPELGSIGDTVWFDANRDGVQDGNEAGVANVLVTLLTGDGTVLASQYTDGNGNYLFEDLAAGDYKVQFDLPAGGYAFTGQDLGGDDAADSDANVAGMTATITLAEGEDNLTIDAGIVELAGALSGRYFLDQNGDDVDNNNGDEPGIRGVLVELLDANGLATGITTTTANDGSYSFSGLDAGTYGVRFTDPNGVLTGLALVAPNQGGDDTSDSDAVGNTTLSTISNISVLAGQETTDNDAGAVPLGSIGDTVFIDANTNGVYDAGDTLADGVEVKLYDGNGGLIGSTTTSNGGQYLFSGLAAGQYQVMFGMLAGYGFTTASAAAADAVNNDSDARTGGLTDVFDLGVGEAELDIDAGLAALPNAAPTPADDLGQTCADKTLTLNLLADNGNGMDSDPDGDAVSVISISDNNETAGVGGTITLDSGAKVTLNSDGTILFDGTVAYADLLIGDHATEIFTYELSDGHTTASGNVDIGICGAKNTIDTIDVALGAVGVVEGTLEFSNVVGGSLYTFNVTDVEFPDSYLGGVLKNLGTFDTAFCLSIATSIDLAPAVNTFNVSVLDAESYSTAIAGAVNLGGTDFGPNPENADNVNWLLNQADDLLVEGFTEGEIQRAIWNLLDGGNDNVLNGTAASTYFASRPWYGTEGNALELTQRALDNDNFVAGEGDVVGVILDPVENGVQPLVIGVEFDLLAQDCTTCDYFLI